MEWRSGGLFDDTVEHGGGFVEAVVAELRASQLKPVVHVMGQALDETVEGLLLLHRVCR